MEYGCGFLSMYRLVKLVQEMVHVFFNDEKSLLQMLAGNFVAVS